MKVFVRVQEPEYCMLQCEEGDRMNVHSIPHEGSKQLQCRVEAVSSLEDLQELNEWAHQRVIRMPHNDERYVWWQFCKALSETLDYWFPNG